MSVPLILLLGFEIRITQSYLYCRKLIISSTANGQLLFTHAWDQLVLNHTNSKNIVFQRVCRFFDTPCITDLFNNLEVFLRESLDKTMIIDIL